MVIQREQATLARGARPDALVDEITLLNGGTLDDVADASFPRRGSNYGAQRRRREASDWRWWISRGGQWHMPWVR